MYLFAKGGVQCGCQFSQVAQQMGQMDGALRLLPSREDVPGASSPQEGLHGSGTERDRILVPTAASHPVGPVRKQK